MTTIADRYPSRRRSRPVIIAAIAIAAAVFLAWVVWAGLAGANPAVAGQVKGFAIVSDAEARATLAVQRTDPGRAATCLVYAQAANFERVGELVVAVAPGPDKIVSLPVDLRTFRRATTVALDHCSLA